MKSTRGGVGNDIPFSKVVIDGYADDGGLYVPNSYPSFDLDVLRKCKSYSDLAFAIFRKFISVDEIPDTDLGKL